MFSLFLLSFNCQFNTTFNDWTPPPLHHPICVSRLICFQPSNQKPFIRRPISVLHSSLSPPISMLWEEVSYISKAPYSQYWFHGVLITFEAFAQSSIPLLTKHIIYYVYFHLLPYISENGSKLKIFGATIWAIQIYFDWLLEWLKKYKISSYAWISLFKCFLPNWWLFIHKGWF